MLAGGEEVHARLEHVTAAYGLELGHTDLAAAIGVIVLHDVHKAHLGAEEHGLTLRRGLAKGISKL